MAWYIRSRLCWLHPGGTNMLAGGFSHCVVPNVESGRSPVTLRHGFTEEDRL